VDAPGLDEVIVVHAGGKSFPLAGGCHAIAFDRVSEDLDPPE